MNKHHPHDILISYRIVLSVNTHIGKLRTQIMQSSSTPHSTLSRYLPHLISQGLIQKLEQANKHPTYKITTKGIQYLLSVEKTLGYLETKNINITYVY